MYSYLDENRNLIYSWNVTYTIEADTKDHFKKRLGGSPPLLARQKKDIYH